MRYLSNTYALACAPRMYTYHAPTEHEYSQLDRLEKSIDARKETGADDDGQLLLLLLRCISTHARSPRRMESQGVKKRAGACQGGDLIVFVFTLYQASFISRWKAPCACNEAVGMIQVEDFLILLLGMTRCCFPFGLLRGRIFARVIAHFSLTRPRARYLRFGERVWAL